MNKQTSITCPECGSYQNRVTDTRYGNLTNHSSHAHLIQLGLKEYTRRRRRCSECGHAWSTVEVPAGELEGAADEMRRMRVLIQKRKWEMGIRF